MKKLVSFIMIFIASSLFASFKAEKIIDTKNIIWGMDFLMIQK